MKLLLLDGNSLINRAFYGIKLLTTKDGRFTNGLFGFMNILLKLREDVGPDGIAAAFDLRAPTFRHAEYDAYKAGRKGMPDELAQQMPILKELLPLMGCHVVEKEGYEADDIIGTLAAAAEKQGHTVFIATGDRDELQLVSDNVTVLLASTKMGQTQTVVYDPAAVHEKYGLTPAQLIDLKALMGDTSDNIPGVAGVGEKTALDLMHRFGSLDNIYSGLDTLDIRDSLREKLRSGEDSARLSRRLGTICLEAPIPADAESYRLKPVDEPALARLLTQLEFFKLIERMGIKVSGPADQAENAPAPVTVAASITPEELIKIVRKHNHLDIAVANSDGGILLFAGCGGQMAGISQAEEAYRTLLSLAADKSIPKRTNDLKRLSSLMLDSGCVPKNVVMDTLLAGYLLNPIASDYSLPRLAQEYFTGSGDDAAALLAPVSDALEREIGAQGQGALFHDIEIPLAVVLADMERLGFEVDADGIAAFGKSLEAQIESLQRAIYESVGYEFNLNSPKQLAQALFEKLGLPSGKKTKTGYSTNAEVLEKLRNVHPAVSMLLDYRQLSKLKSTYCDGLAKVIGADGRIHSSFNQTETRTGRISSTEPNLQNIPVRQELGRELRRFFRAREGYLLCDADYSQIELRVLAHMSGDRTMIDAFNSGTDIHSVTASQVFEVPADGVTPLMRSRAKAVNFGIVYGIGAHSLSEDIGVGYGEAKRYIDQYLAHYGGVAAFMDGKIAEAKANGYSSTIFGRRRPLPELTASNANMRAFGERVARNMPIQGTAADIIKIAMIKVWERLKGEGMRSRLILQVHDELIVEAPEEEAEHAAEILREEMENAAKLDVKLEVDVHIGKTWYDAKG